MNRAELIAEIAQLTGLPKTEVGSTLQCIIHTVTGALSKGDKVTLVGFGTFERRTRQARTGRNPRTLAPLKIAASKVPAFRAGQELKDVVDGRAKQKSFAGVAKVAKVAKIAKATKAAAKKAAKPVAKKAAKAKSKKR